ncbi:hypothetical protein BDD12DRAFT_833431 [Trichophaea hybrida]|nr:hypothetical protein BDD12DRAFT_833431 [Trichophaea hybrida]
MITIPAVVTRTIVGLFLPSSASSTADTDQSQPAPSHHTACWIHILLAVRLYLWFFWPARTAQDPEVYSTAVPLHARGLGRTREYHRRQRPRD